MFLWSCRGGPNCYWTADLVSMNETFVRARTIFDRMMEESLARHSGGRRFLLPEYQKSGINFRQCTTLGLATVHKPHSIVGALMQHRTILHKADPSLTGISLDITLSLRLLLPTRKDLTVPTRLLPPKPSRPSHHNRFRTQTRTCHQFQDTHHRIRVSLLQPLARMDPRLSARRLIPLLKVNHNIKLSKRLLLLRFNNRLSSNNCSHSRSLRVRLLSRNQRSSPRQAHMCMILMEHMPIKTCRHGRSIMQLEAPI
jgi:hypothetical protein